MHFINSVMADYIKPFISDQKGTKEKLEQKDEEKPITRSGMGDFDYESFPLVAMRENMTDTDLLDHFSKKTYKLFVSMDMEIAENFEEQKNLEDKLNTMEREIERRKYLYDMCLDMCNKESVELEKYSEKNKKIDSTIIYLQQMVDSWQCIIDDFRKIPEECE